MLDNSAFLPAEHPRTPEVRELDAAFLAAHHDRIAGTIRTFREKEFDPARFMLLVNVPLADVLAPQKTKIYAVHREGVRNLVVEKEFAPLCEEVERRAPPEGTLWLFLKMPGHVSAFTVSLIPNLPA